MSDGGLRTGRNM